MPYHNSSSSNNLLPNKRLNFTINFCSSQDVRFPATQLTLQSPDSDGWQSQRFSTYPQTIIIELVELSVVQKLTFLSHQTKITTKIDIECKQGTNSPEWKRLGYTCMQSNMNTNYEARQMRTVKLSKQKVKLFRFIFHHNYVNNQNVFNQVGIIAISVYGQRYHSKPEIELKQNGESQRGVLPPGAILDKQTLDKMRQLEYMKRQAVQSNQFQKARQIKHQIERLKSGVQALAILQKQKRQAIKREDYDQAKLLYEKMNRIRGPLPKRFNKLPSPNNVQLRRQYQSARQFKQEQEEQQYKIRPQPQPLTQQHVKKKSISLSPVINFDQIPIKPSNNSANIFDSEYYNEQQKKYHLENKNTAAERRVGGTIKRKKYLLKNHQKSRSIEMSQQPSPSKSSILTSLPKESSSSPPLVPLKKIIKQPKINRQRIHTPKNPEYQCQYCYLFDKRLQNQNFRDIHWFKECPMITICQQCSQAIEVQSLNQHLLGQCQRKKYYKRCPRCKQAVGVRQFNKHLQNKMCIPVKPAQVANRCPLCHEDIEPNAKGWLKHLSIQGCPCSMKR